MDEKALRWALSIGLILLVGPVILFVYGYIPASLSQENPFETAEDGRADMSRRAADFPSTYISVIHLDLTSPNHGIRLEWTGPQAAEQDQGPFHSSPGRGTGRDCNHEKESQRDGSCCTPKGTRYVEGFNDFLQTAPACRFVTWFHLSREIGIHSHHVIPSYPSSLGCVRVNAEAAQLIHNNAIKGKTRVYVAGEWTPPPDLQKRS